MAAKLTARVAQLYGNGWMIFRIMSASPRLSGWQRRSAGIKSVRYAVETGRGADHLANAALEGTLPMTIPGDVDRR